MANAQRPVWSSDTRISVPVPPDDPILVPMYGFGFTRFGLFHDLSSTDYDYMRSPTYAPELPAGEIVFDDLGIERT
jgi:hypothetical protein